MHLTQYFYYQLILCESLCMYIYMLYNVLIQMNNFKSVDVIMRPDIIHPGKAIFIYVHEGWVYSPFSLINIGILRQA